MKLAHRVSLVQPSPTLAITAKAKAMQQAGHDIVSFGAGEPDFDTPAPICRAAKDALDAGHTRYTAVPGITPLREAIARDYARRGREVRAEEVIVSVGGKHALYNATQVLFERGDRVLVPGPYWVSYPAQISLAGAECVEVLCPGEAEFKLSAERLDQLLDDSFTGLILCSPSNPTGAVYSSEELAALGEVIAAHPKLVVFFDAMYDRLYYGGSIAPDLIASAPQIAEQVITFNGFSKTYAMTGWRLGYAIGPPPVIEAMSKLQSQSTSNATSIVQYAGLSALQLKDETIAEMRDAFRARRDLIVAGLNALPGVRCATPQGAFYAFPDFSALLQQGALKDDLALAEFLLEEARVAVVPGSAFGAPGYLRFSYATSEALIREGLGRLREALSSG